MLDDASRQRKTAVLPQFLLTLLHPAYQTLTALSPCVVGFDTDIKLLAGVCCPSGYKAAVQLYEYVTYWAILFTAQGYFHYFYV